MTQPQATPESTAPPAPGLAAFPIALGETVGGWKVRQIAGDPQAIRFLLEDPSGQQVTLTLKREPNPGHRSPFNPLYYESTKLRFEAFAEAGRTLAARLSAAVPGGDPVRSFGLLQGVAPAGALPGQNGSSRSAAPIPVREGDTGALPPPHGGDVVIEAGAPFPLARLLEVLDGWRPLKRRTILRAAAEALTPRTVRTLGEAHPELIWLVPLPPGGPVDVEALIDLADAAILLNLTLDFVCPATQRGLAVAAELVPLVSILSIRPEHRVRLVVELPEMSGAPGSSEKPVALSALRALPEPVRGFLDRTGSVRAAGTMPPCLLPSTLTSLLRDKRDLPRPTDAVFAAGCGECSLRSICPGLDRGYADRFGTGELRPFKAGAPPAPTGSSAAEVVNALPWEDKARWLLLDRPGVGIALRDLVSAPLPELRCVRPWTHLEVRPGRFGPCCGEYMAVHAPCPDDANPRELWKSDVLRSFRLALLTEEKPHTCRDSCPILAGRAEELKDFNLQGGSEALVENQIRLARNMIEQRLDLDHEPISIGVNLTSYCNYDCLMCNCGRDGTLDDQKTPVWYEQLRPWLDTLLVFDANGGEPFATPHFRAFLEELARSSYPVRVNVITNGSYLTEKWLARWEKIPFNKLIISLNAADPTTYEDVNRGLPWSGIRRNLDEVLRLRRTGRFLGDITYSMVVLKRNVAEIQGFAALAAQDGVGVRYMLPMRDFNEQSIMTGPGTMSEAAAGLEAAAKSLDARRMEFHARDTRSQLAVLQDRLDRKLFKPLGTLSLPLVAGPILIEN